jgi:aryl-alcohol dehydrogenase-like predicted oxidoreductase
MGASKPSQIDEDVAAAGVKLSQEILDAIDRVTLPVVETFQGTQPGRR